jgi:hypothetical protein
MKSHVLALAALAAVGLSGAAYAGDAKSVTKAPVAMSDAEMDAVTAGKVSFRVITFTKRVDTSSANLQPTTTGFQGVNVEHAAA